MKPFKTTLKTVGQGYRADKETLDGRFTVRWQRCSGALNHWLVMDEMGEVRPVRCYDLYEVQEWFKELIEEINNEQL